MVLTKTRLLKHGFPIQGIAIPIASSFSRYRRVSRYAPPFGGVSNYVEGRGVVRGCLGGGGISQVNAAFSAIGRYRGFSSYTIANRG